MVKRAGTDTGSTKRLRTGVAISSTELCATDTRLRGASDRAWRAPLAPPPTDGASWPSLAAALGDLADAVGTTNGTLAISLMPPLTEVRRLELPPVRDDELQRLIVRNASRYFVNARGAQIVGTSSAAKRSRGAPVPVVAAAAAVRLVAAVRAAAQQAGWEVESIAPAETAWAASAFALWPSFARQSAFALFAHEDRTDLLQLENGRLVGVRRFRAGAGDAPMIVDTIGPTARIGVAGAVAPRKELISALAELHVSATPAAGDWATFAERADLLAAQFAGSEVGPVLRADDSVAVEREQARKVTLSFLAAAAVVLLVAGAVELWGVHRQLRAVQDERARLRPQIASTLLGRTTVDATSRNLAALNAIERSTPQWSAIITTLSQSVPEDAYFTAIRARQDSLIVDGLAEHAARVFDALSRTPTLVDVKAAAPVRRELQEDGTPLDHFTIAARVAAPVANVPTTSPASAKGAAPAVRRPSQ